MVNGRYYGSEILKLYGSEILILYGSEISLTNDSFMKPRAYSLIQKPLPLITSFN